MIRAVLFDFGGVVIRTPFEMAAGLEKRLGLAQGALGLHGPFNPTLDPQWRLVQVGKLHEREYWHLQADRLGPMIGESDDTLRQLIDALFDAPPSEVLRAITLMLRQDLVHAGMTVAVLTNDLARFHDPSWIERMDVYRLFDPFVDLSHTDTLKPDPVGYQVAVEALEIEPAEILFVDDQPVNVEGAVDAGLEAVRFDILDPAGSADAVRRKVGL